ncbi:MAG: M20/M25/M40 family metallo-hydrolase [Caulobacter sp.]
MSNANRLRTLWLMLAVLLGLGLGVVGLLPPAPAPADAPDEAFSTARALPDLTRLSAEPHPTGSPQNAAVRDWLVGRMDALGLSPTVQRTTGVNSGEGWMAAGLVENVIGVLPGKDRRAPAVMLMAHYDTVPGSPGAGDDSTGVAAILEIVRAIKVRGQPARDIIVLITDAEETGLLGAEAFFSQHPMAGRVGAIVNLEARGGGGRANMFETSRENGALIALYAPSARKPVSSALSVFLYERMPNGTDFTIPKDKGVAGLNFAFIGRQFDYHSATATLANLDKGSVQSIGEQGLEATAALAYAPALPGKAPNAVYSQTFGDHILVYPQPLGWIAVGLAALLLLVAGWRARRAGVTPGWRDGLKGAGGGLLVLTASAAVLNLARRATTVGFGYMEQRPLLAQWVWWEAAMIALGLAVLLGVPWLAARGRARLATAIAAAAVGAAASLFGGFDMVGLVLGGASAVLALLVLGRPAEPGGSWAGLLLLGLVLAGLAQLLQPEVAFLLAWPLVLACLAAAISGFRADGAFGIAPLAASILVIGWLGPYLHLTAQGLDFPALLGLFAFIAAFAVWPLAAGGGSRLSVVPAALALVVGLGLLGFVRFSDPWTARHPQASVVMHVTEADSGRSWLATPHLTDWTRRALEAAGPGEIVEASLPPWTASPVYVKRTAAAGAAGAVLDQRVEPDGRAVLTLTPPPGARVMRLELGAVGEDVRLQDRAVTLRPSAARKPGAAAEPYRINWTGDGAPLTLSFMPARTPGATEARWYALTERWPEGAAPLPRRPAEVMPWGTSDGTLVTGRAKVSW